MTDIPSPVPAPGPCVSAPTVSRAIYGMPMFATLAVADIDATTSWYVDGLGFISLFPITAVYAELDELAARARAHGGGGVDGPADTPWNTRDLTTVDPDGNVVVFTAARPADQADSAFREQMRRWNEQQGITAC